MWDLQAIHKKGQAAAPSSLSLSGHWEVQKSLEPAWLRRSRAAVGEQSPPGPPVHFKASRPSQGPDRNGTGQAEAAKGFIKTLTAWHNRRRRGLTSEVFSKELAQLLLRSFSMKHKEHRVTQMCSHPFRDKVEFYSSKVRMKHLGSSSTDPQQPTLALSCILSNSYRTIAHSHLLPWHLGTEINSEHWRQSRWCQAFQTAMVQPCSLLGFLHPWQRWPWGSRASGPRPHGHHSSLQRRRRPLAHHRSSLPHDSSSATPRQN